MIAIALLLVFVCLLNTFPRWHKASRENGGTTDIRPFPTRLVAQLALFLGFVASVLSLVSVVWQHSAAVAFSVAVEGLGDGIIRSRIGTLSAILSWTAVSLTALVTLSLSVTILSIGILDRLGDGADNESPTPLADGDE